MQNTLSRADLWSLEEYAEIRPSFRAEVMAHKKHRQLALGENVRLYFEDSLTIRYQIQEMLRIEKVFESEGILEELDAYNPLIPDGHNWKATLMVEYEDPAERAEQLSRLVGIEKRVLLRVDGHDPVVPITDEDLERENDAKTSSVHFMRYELTPEMISAIGAGADIIAEVDHPVYTIEPFVIDRAVRESLAGDLRFDEAA